MSIEPVTLRHDKAATMRPNLYAFAAGLAAACAFEPLGLWPLMLVALAALAHLVAEAPTLRAALAKGWWFGFGHFALGLNWIATAFTFQAAMPAWLGWVAVVLLSLYLAIYPAAAAGLAWRWAGSGAGSGGRRDPLGLVLILAAAWIVTEWLRAGLFTGFAWNPAGVALLPTIVARLATLVGTYGLSGVTMLLGGAGWLLAKRAWRPALALAAPVAAASLLLLALAPPPPPAGAGLPLRIVQPNIGQEDKWREGQAPETMRRLDFLSRARGTGPRLLLWPEAAVTEPLENQLADPLERFDAVATRREVAAMLGPRDVLLTGGVTWRSVDGNRLSSATNSIFAIDATGRILARYDKAHLVPYGEYLPMRPVLSALGLSRLVPGDVDFDPGPGARTFDLPLVGKVGFQLCYEIVFSGQVVDRAHRPLFLFNPSNDAWFGRWGPPQHLAQARLRALEEGLPVLRSTPTGISAMVDGEGRLLHALGWRRMGAIDARLPPPLPPTPFARLGNLLPLLFALLLVAAAIAVRRKAR
jgi:apolipoprotein N-acyltransferase